MGSDIDGVGHLWGRSFMGSVIHGARHSWGQTILGVGHSWGQTFMGSQDLQIINTHKISSPRDIRIQCKCDNWTKIFKLNI